MGSIGSEGQQLLRDWVVVWGTNSMIYCRLICVAGHVVSRKDDHEDSTSTSVIRIKCKPVNRPGRTGENLNSDAWGYSVEDGASRRRRVDGGCLGLILETPDCPQALGRQQCSPRCSPSPQWVRSTQRSSSHTAPFLAPKRLPPSRYPGRPLWCLSWQLTRSAFALRWAFSRRLPSTYRHRSLPLFLLSVGYSCVHRQPNMKSPVCGMPQTRLRRGREEDSNLRRHGGVWGTDRTSRILMENAQIQTDPRFCPVRLRQRF